MTITRMAALTLCSALWLAACGDGDEQPTTDSATPAADQRAPERDAGGADTQPPIAADQGPPADAPAADAGQPADLGALFTDGGCLSFAGASQVCGFKSDESVCTLAVSCKITTDVGQCKINCEMGATSGGGCYDAAAVACLTDAVASASCDALKACNWIL